MGVLMFRDVPEKLHKRFKAACVLDRRSMREAVFAFMECTADSREILEARKWAGTRRGGAKRRTA